MPYLIIPRVIPTVPLCFVNFVRVFLVKLQLLVWYRLLLCDLYHQLSAFEIEVVEFLLRQLKISLVSELLL